MLWFQQSAPDLVQDRLMDAFKDDGTMIRQRLPDKWSPRAGPVPMVTVAGDGQQVAARGTDRELVRVTVHADSQPRARKVMSVIDSFLTTPGIQFLGFSISRSGGSGLISGPDSLSGGYFASATYVVGTSRRKVDTHGT